MKKNIFLAFSFIVSILFSCNSEKEKLTDNIENNDKIEQNKIEELIVEKEIIFPVLSNEDAIAFAKKYDDYVVELKAAAGENQDKLTELTFKAVELEKEFIKVKENLSEEDKKNLSEFIETLKQSVQ